MLRCGALRADRPPSEPSSRGLHLLLDPAPPRCPGSPAAPPEAWPCRGAGPERWSCFPFTAAKSPATPFTRRCGRSCTGTSASAGSKPGPRAGGGQAGGRARASAAGSHALSLRFLETVELQISLKNHDPQKDKRFSGTVRLSPRHPNFSVCALGDQQHRDEAEAMDIGALKKLNKKLAKKYDAFLVSESWLQLLSDSSC